MLLIEKNGKKYIDERIERLIENGNNDELVSLLQNETPKDNVTSSGKTLLHYSVLYNNYFMTNFLINWGVDVNAQDEEGNSPLLFAINIMDYDQVELLLNANADLKVKNLKSENAFTMNTHLWNTDGPSEDIFKLLFDKLKMYHSSIEEMVETLLICGCHLSDVPYFKYPYTIQFMKIMLQKKYYHINSQNNRNGQTILHTAVELNEIDLIKELLLLGSDITVENKHCSIPITWYILFNCRNQNQEIVKMLMPKEYNWMQLDGMGVIKRLRIRIVFTHSTIETLIKFRENYEIDMKATDGIGETPLHYLSHNNNKGILSVFEDFEFDINAQDNRYRRKAIHYAAEHGDVENIKFLLARNAELDHLDVFGRTPLMYAVYNSNDKPSNKECVQLLLLHGANAQIINVRHQSVLSLALTHLAYNAVDPVLAHLALFEATGGEIVPLILDQIDSDDEIKTRFDSCKQQLEDMKEDYIWRSVSIFDCLTGSYEKLALSAQWHTFIDRFAKQEFNFNSYFVSLLRKRFAKAIEIRDMRRKVALALEEIFNLFNLGYFLTNEIVNYLDYNDLQKFY